jgi:hypothetical protein
VLNAVDLPQWSKDPSANNCCEIRGEHFMASDRHGLGIKPLDPPVTLHEFSKNFKRAFKEKNLTSTDTGLFYCESS